MAAGDQTLATKDTTTLILNGGIYWVEGGPDWGTAAQRKQLDQLLRDPEGNQALKRFYVASVTLIAARAFYSYASAGCGASHVNRLLFDLAVAVVTSIATAFIGTNWPKTYSTVNQLLSCIAKGLVPTPGALVFVLDGTIELREPRGYFITTFPLSTWSRVGGGAMLDSGIWAASGGSSIGNDGTVTVWTPARALIGSVTLGGIFAPVFGELASSETAFFAGRSSQSGADYTKTVTQVSSAGAQVAIVTLPGTGILRSFGVSWDGSTIYYSEMGAGGPTDQKVLYSTAGTFASDGTYYVYGIVGLASGNVASLWWKSATALQLRIHTSAGSLVATYILPSPISSGAARITRGGDNTSVFIWHDAYVCEVRVSDGAVLNAFTISHTISTTGFFVARTTLT